MIADAYVYLKHFQYLERPGVYLDIAANDPIQTSNTFFMDRCLQWRGICVEANPRYFGPLSDQRSCLLIPTCVSSKEEEVIFRYSGAVGGIESTVKTPRKETDVSHKIRCTTMDLVMDRVGVNEVDFMSLDVEGHELSVLQGIDWNKTVIKVITVEMTDRSSVSQFLGQLGYRIHVPEPLPPQSEWDEYTLRYKYDTLFLHPSVTWGTPE